MNWGVSSYCTEVTDIAVSPILQIFLEITLQSCLAAVEHW